MYPLRIIMFKILRNTYFPSRNDNDLPIGLSIFSSFEFVFRFSTANSGVTTDSAT